jgi:hypothetical protein
MLNNTLISEFMLTDNIPQYQTKHGQVKLLHVLLVRSTLPLVSKLP